MACFDLPLVFVSAAATIVAGDEDAARAQFGPVFDALARKGFASTVADDVVTQLVGDDLALVDARFTRRRTDGSVLGKVAALYVCRRTGAGWRIASVVQHPHEVPALRP